MADEKTDDAAINPEDLDEVAGGALNAYIKLDGVTESLQKTSPTEITSTWVEGG